MPTLSALTTPGVYVQEIDSFPPSIAQVATAIPVFIGYTEFAIDDKGKNLTNIPFAISSMVEYTTYFGGPPTDLNTLVTLNPDNSVNSVSTTPTFQMFNALSMFFYNGGGDCYILSVKNYPSNNQANLNDFLPSGGTTLGCFDILKKYDEPTLIVIPDAAMMLNTNDYNTLINEALSHCGDMQSRFTIIDVPQSNTAPATTAIEATVNSDSGLFRSGIVGSNLNYGAAYYPYLQTNLPCPSSYSNITLKSGSGINIQLTSLLPPGDVNVLQITNAVSDQAKFVEPYTTIPDPSTATSLIDFTGTGPEDVTGAGVITGGVINVSIKDAYTNIVTAPSKNRLTNSIKFLVDVITSFVKLNGSFTDKPGASGYVNIPSGTTIQEIHALYIKPGTSSLISSFESLLVTLIQIDQNYPDITNTANSPVPLNVIDQSKVQTWIGNTYLTGAIPAATNIYGTLGAVTTDDNAVAAVMPIVDNVFATLMSVILNFASDVTNRVNALDQQIASSSSVYNNIKTAIKNTGLIVPPSGAMAGIYAATDGTRGVWKAPANVAPLNVIKPTIPIDDDIQGKLNVDTNAGKSINAIRAFTGKGTLVWGARTLTGNDNNWRYISVRRTYIMVETSTRRAVFQFVFEPNDIHTWLRVKAMIQNFLFLLWQEGALAGVKPEQAYYVSVGLGQTMTAQDILEGRMIIEIGMAVVRPAEFIVLRFTQIQQQS